MANAVPAAIAIGWPDASLIGMAIWFVRFFLRKIEQSSDEQ